MRGSEERSGALFSFFLEAAINRPRLLLADGMHPNADGVDAIVDEIGPRVARELTS